MRKAQLKLLAYLIKDPPPPRESGAFISNRVWYFTPNDPIPPFFIRIPELDTEVSLPRDFLIKQKLLVETKSVSFLKKKVKDIWKRVKTFRQIKINSDRNIGDGFSIGDKK